MIKTNQMDIFYAFLDNLPYISMQCNAIQMKYKLIGIDKWQMNFAKRAVSSKLQLENLNRIGM